MYLCDKSHLMLEWASVDPFSAAEKPNSDNRKTYIIVVKN